MMKPAGICRGAMHALPAASGLQYRAGVATWWPCHWSYGDNIARWDGGYQMTGAVMRRHHEDVIWSM